MLPVIVPELCYSNLDCVKDGGLAMGAYLEASHTQTSLERRQSLHRQLLAYCNLDTYAMVKLWQMLVGRMDQEL